MAHWTAAILHAIRTALICPLLATLALSACAPPDDSWTRLRQSGTLRVGMDASYPPFEWIAQDGTLTGFDVELARELGQRLGLDVQFVANLPYDGLYDALAMRQVDVIISALVISPDRMDDFAYSMAYFDAGQVLVVRADEQNVIALADLAGRTLAVELGSQGDLAARTLMGRSSTVSLVPCQTAQEALDLVERTEADAALVDHVSALVDSARGQLMILEGMVVEEPYAVAVRHGEDALLQAINNALAAMSADGTLRSLHTYWLERQDG
ncbi:MAG: amino acid ABC transporter substrate-binding protein [Anaerolineales bacterium]|nr:amino acid ABC transporter substrate-binding protein [Anaerolineales bacterium]